MRGEVFFEDNFSDNIFKLFVYFSWDVNVGEKISEQAIKDINVFKYYFWVVEISQRSK